jgi:hypothetical protein
MTAKINADDPCYSIADFTHMVGLSRQRLQQLWDVGKGPPVRRGRGHAACIPLAEAQDWMLERATSPHLNDEDRERYIAMLDRISEVRHALANLEDTARWIADITERRPPMHKVAIKYPGKRYRKRTDKDASDWLPILPLPSAR